MGAVEGMAELNKPQGSRRKPQGVTRVSTSTYRVDQDGRSHIVYVCGPPENRWAFWNGRVYRSGTSAITSLASRAPGRRVGAPRSRLERFLMAPMPATVVKVLVSAGTAVKEGEALIVLEAMKMELKIRASADGTVSAVHCQEGDLVQPDTVLIELADEHG